MHSVACIGVATLDYIAVASDPLLPDGRIVAEEILEAGGGNAATAAVALVRLGIPVDFIGSIGDDPVGATIHHSLTAEGVRTAGLRRVPGGRSPASVIVVNPATAQRSIVTLPAVGTDLQLSPADLAACANAAWIHMDYAGHKAIPQLRQAGITTPISLDAGNFVPDLNLREITLYAPTQSALCRTTQTDDVETAIRLALAAGPRIVAVTMGEQGSLAGVREESGEVQLFSAPSFPVPKMGSTLGAGDVFHGALVAGLVHGLEIEPALRQANMVAALACRGTDGRSAIPTRAELAACYHP